MPALRRCQRGGGAVQSVWQPPRGGAGQRRAARRCSRQEGSLRQPDDLATRYSHPPALVALLTRESCRRGQLRGVSGGGQRARRRRRCRYNPLQNTAAGCLGRADGGGRAPARRIRGCRTAAGVRARASLETARRHFAMGACYVQDAAAAAGGRGCAGLQPGMRVLDACAAPGGKSFAAGHRGWKIAARSYSLRHSPAQDRAARKGRAAARYYKSMHARMQDASAPVPGIDRRRWTLWWRMCRAPGSA